MKLESINTKLKKENELKNKATNSVKDMLHSRNDKKSLEKYLGNPYEKR